LKRLYGLLSACRGQVRSQEVDLTCRRIGRIFVADPFEKSLKGCQERNELLVCAAEEFMSLRNQGGGESQEKELVADALLPVNAYAARFGRRPKVHRVLNQPCISLTQRRPVNALAIPTPPFPEATELEQSERFVQRGFVEHLFVGRPCHPPGVLKDLQGMVVLFAPP
jgi:hypothetical protein